MKKDLLPSLLALIPFLDNHPGISRERLARKMNCSVDEISELLNQVLMCGSPPYLPDDYIGFHLDGDGIHLRYASHFSRPISLTLQEALSVIVLLNEVGLYSEGSFEKSATSLRSKLIRALGTMAGHDLEAVADRLVVSRGAELRGEIVSALQSAIVGCSALEIDYYSVAGDETRRRRVHPYGLVENTGDVYMVGHCTWRNAIRTFRVDRIKALETTEERFEIPADFDLEAYRLDELYHPGPKPTRITIRFTGSAADWAREAWDAKSLSDEGDSVVLTLASDSPEWVTRFCMKFGSEAELLEPEAYRHAIATAVGYIRSQYKS